MDLVIRGIVVYVFLNLVMRAAGNRQLSQVTAIDLVLLLIISEVTQQAFIGAQDFSVTAAIVLILTLVGADLALSFLRRRVEALDLVLGGVPMLLVDEGKPVKKVMDKERLGEREIMAAAREKQGLESLDDVKYAVLERDGVISVIPKQR
jgi:uncharacterized membrane protein YcaP (DUF421 family)